MNEKINELITVQCCAKKRKEKDEQNQREEHRIQQDEICAKIEDVGRAMCTLQIEEGREDCGF
jgi:hypothetical protein